MEKFRPLSTGEILDRSLDHMPGIVKEISPYLVCIGVIATTSAVVDRGLKSNDFPDLTQMVSGGAVLIVLGAAQIVISLFLYLLCTVLSGASWDARKLSRGEAKSQLGFRMVLRMLGQGIWIGVGTTIGFILFIIPGLIFFLNRAIAPYILVLENTTVDDSLRKSKSLMSSPSGERWLSSWFSSRSPKVRISAVMLVSMILATIPGVVTGVLSLENLSLDLVSFTVLTFATSIISAIATVYSTVVYVGFYRDLQNRYLGRDLFRRLEEIPGE